MLSLVVWVDTLALGDYWFENRLLSTDNNRLIYYNQKIVYTRKINYNKKSIVID